MIELGELERHHEDFARRQARVIVVSVEDRDTAAKTQTDFPHLTVIADAEGNLISMVNVVDAGAGPEGKDIAAPTTMLIDRAGIVRWLFRPDRSIARLSAADLLRAVDEHLGAPE